MIQRAALLLSGPSQMHHRPLGCQGPTHYWHHSISASDKCNVGQALWFSTVELSRVGVDSVYTEFTTSSRRLLTDSVDNLETDSIAV